jgi:hypothetical protein
MYYTKWFSHHEYLIHIPILFADNGTVVIRQTQDEVLSTSSTPSSSDREGRSRDSELRTAGPIRSYEPSEGIQGARLSPRAFEEPPPSYDVVMSQNYPIMNETILSESGSIENNS